MVKRDSLLSETRSCGEVELIVQHRLLGQDGLARLARSRLQKKSLPKRDEKDENLELNCLLAYKSQI